jgi:hypothetical protein
MTTEARVRPGRTSTRRTALNYNNHHDQAILPAPAHHDRRRRAGTARARRPRPDRQRRAFADGSYLAQTPDRLQLAIVIHPGRLKALRLRRQRAPRVVRRPGPPRPPRPAQRAGDRLTVRLRARSARTRLTLTLRR